MYVPLSDNHPFKNFLVFNKKTAEQKWCAVVYLTNSEYNLNLKSFLESGVLELYALGLLDDNERLDVEIALVAHDEVRKEYDAIQKDLEDLAFSQRIEPSRHLKKVVVDSILNLQKENEMALGDLPLITKHSNHLNWLKLTNGIKQLSFVGGRHIKILRADENVTQILVVSETDIPEEVHENEYESFLILGGTCQCTINGEVTFMGPGDFMEIPLHQKHDVAVINRPVTAILQLVKR